MAVSYWARNQVGDTFEMSVPGMFALKRDAAGFAQTNPLPFHLGPICEHCWLKHGRIRTVSDPQCPHGGAS